MRHIILALMLAIGASSAQAQGMDARAANELIVRANAAVVTRNWPEVEKIARQLVAIAPDQWDYQKLLAEAVDNQGRYQEAAASYDKGIALAEKKLGGADADKVKPALALMYLAKGNTQIRLKNFAVAVAAFEKSAALSTNPAISYFNICATMYNTGNVKGALASCDKAIAADPTKADAYFIKGSLLFADATVEKGKMVAPPAAVAALRKYLELAPNGAHVSDVNEMLKAVGEPIVTTYQKKK